MQLWPVMVSLVVIWIGYLSALSLYVFLHLIWSIQWDLFYMYICSAALCFLFSPFIFKVIISRKGLDIVILLMFFCCTVLLCLFSSFVFLCGSLIYLPYFNSFLIFFFISSILLWLAWSLQKIVILNGICKADITY